MADGALENNKQFQKCYNINIFVKNCNSRPIYES